MSYDIELLDPITRQVVELDEAHQMMGGTYQFGGTRTAWLNVTWNYAPHFYRLLGEKGIRSIYGRPAGETDAPHRGRLMIETRTPATTH